MKIYHNPKCSKSRQTLQLLSDHGEQPEIVEYLKTTPDAETLKSILKKLGISARQLLRTKEAEFKSAGLDNMDLGDDEIIAAMIKHPKLIERPIVVKGNQAVIGRPPENILIIINK